MCQRRLCGDSRRRLSSRAKRDRLEARGQELEANSCFSGRRGRIRTCNPRIRNPMLYPFELRARKSLIKVALQRGRREKSSIPYNDITRPQHRRPRRATITSLHPYPSAPAIPATHTPTFPCRCSSHCAAYLEECTPASSRAAARPDSPQYARPRCRAELQDTLHSQMSSATQYFPRASIWQTLHASRWSAAGPSVADNRRQRSPRRTSSDGVGDCLGRT